MNNKGWSLNKKVKFRREYFGGLCWFLDGKVFELDKTGISIIELFEKPSILNINSLMIENLSSFLETFKKLIDKNILIKVSDANCRAITKNDIDSVIIKNNKIYN